MRRIRGGRILMTAGLAGLLLVAACTDDATTARGSPDPTATLRGNDEPPSALADGSAPPELPRAVQAAVEGPAMGAALVDESHPLVRSCQPEDPEAAFVNAYLTPFVGSAQFEVQAEIAGEPRGRTLLACDVVWVDDEVEPESGVLHPWDTDEALRAAGAALSYVGGGEAMAAAISVPVPENTAWLVHPQDGFAVVYPVQDGAPVRLSTPGTKGTGELTVHVVYLDETGEVLGEEDVTGAVAG